MLGKDNSKTIKGEKEGYTTYIMYLSPHKQNSLGKNLCSHASKGCAEACLFTAGRGRMSNVQQARINKTEYFLTKKFSFMYQLYKELTTIQKRHKKSGTKFCVRLNGTSDIPWEYIRIINNKSIFELFPDIQFYDYTKIPNRLFNKYPNYHLTFSKSEINDSICNQLLNEGYNVAMVFNQLPTEYKGYKVINGDKNDLRFLDDKNVIVGLTAKGDAKKDKSGFTINI